MDKCPECDTFWTYCPCCEALFCDICHRIAYKEEEDEEDES